jgi:uncharacterized protein YbjQ (UPF0145 family)
MAKQCSVCQKEGALFKNVRFIEVHGKDYCAACADDYLKKTVAPVKVTTTSNLEGFRIKRYIDIDSVEVVIGTGAFSEFMGDVSDFFGARSSAFEKKLQQARRTAIDKLRYNAVALGGNAVVGIDLDYTEFSNNRIGVVANGTVVEAEPAG